MDFLKSKLAKDAPGERLLWLRSTITKGRKDFCLKHDLNERTLVSWELEDNKLTKKVAAKLVAIFNKEGIVCTDEWLLSGTGMLPESIETICNYMPSFDSAAAVDANDINIQRESQFFMEVNPGAKIFNMPDDSMEPELFCNDVIGCLPIAAPYKQDLNGMVCAIETKDQLYVKKVSINPDTELFNLSSTNPATKIAAPTIFNIKPETIYKIVWIRRTHQP